MISLSKAEQLPSFSKTGSGELGNGLLKTMLYYGQCENGELLNNQESKQKRC